MHNLTIDGVSKSFDGISALRDVSFSVDAGQKVALLGHNGAGKTTLMKAILGLQGADSGRIEVLGSAPGSARARASASRLS